MVAKSFSTEFGKPCVWIEDIYVKDAYRGLGIGSHFLKFIESKYPDAILRLEVEAENERAVNVYQKCGFEVVRCADGLLEDHHGTTWFVIARKP